MESDKRLDHLRNKAEQILQQRGTEEFYYNIEKLIEELNIHQIELELQNMELQSVNEKLQLEQQRYKELYMDAPIPYLTLNETGNIVELNDAAARMFKKPHQQFSYSSVFPFLANESKVHFNRFFKEVFNSTAVHTREINFVDSGGNTLFTKVSAKSFLDQARQIYLCRLSITDFTREKELNDEVRRSQQKLKLLTNNSFDIISILDKAGNVVYESDAIERILEYKPDSRTGQSVFNYIHPDDRQHVISKFKTLLEEEEGSQRVEFRMMHKRGHYVWLEAIGRNFLKTPQINGVIVNSRDVTERKISMQLIKENETKLKTTFDVLDVGITITDAVGHVIDCNKASEDILGITKQEHLSRNFAGKEWEIIRPDMTPMPSDDFASVRAMKEQKTIKNVLMGIVRAPGDIVWISVNASPLYLPGYGVVITYIDVTQNKEAQDLVKQKNDDLQILNAQYVSQVEEFRQLTEVLDSTNQELRKSENKFQTIFKEDKAIKLLIDPQNGRIADANEAAVDFYGYSFEQLTQMSIDQINIYAAPKVKELMDKAKMQELNYFQFKHRIADGQIKDVEVYSTPMYIEDKAMLFSIIHDITARKVAELQLGKLSTVLEQSPTSVIITDLMGNMEYVNPHFTLFTGYSYEEALGQNPRLLKSGYHEDLFYKQMWDTVKQGKIWTGEIYNKHKDGTGYWSESIIAPIFDHDNQIINYVGIGLEISERKKMEQELRESEEKFRFLSENATDGVCLFENNIMTYVSDGLLNQIGYEKHELVNLRVDEILSYLHPADTEYYREQMTEAIKSREASYRLRYRLLTKRGKYLWFENSVKSEYDETGKHRRSIIQVRNVEDRVQNEIQLREHEQELIKLNADKDRFMQVLAHDLRSPFNSLLGFSELLLQNLHKYDKEKIRNYISIINQNQKRTYNLLNDLLLWSKAQAGKLAFTPQELILDEVCKEMLLEKEFLAQEKNIELICQADKDLQVWADRNMLSTILRNLLSNAIKFTPRNGLVKIYAEKLPNGTQISVEDTGVGISEDDRKLLWNNANPFSKPGTDNEKGTGLGLLLCQEFVQKHSGQISVASTEGKGSTFSFTLPHK